MIWSCMSVCMYVCLYVFVYMLYCDISCMSYTGICMCTLYTSKHQSLNLCYYRYYPYILLFIYQTTHIGNHAS